MKKLIILIGLLAGLGLSQVATAEPQTAVVSGIEPIENTDGSPIVDLQTIRIYYSKTGSPAIPSELLIHEIPATQPTGGGEFSETISIDIATCQTETYMFYATAISTAGESDPSSTGSKTFVSELPCPKPNAPVGLSIQ